MSKKSLLNNLKKDTYCRIGISTIPGAGVGVIAINDIPKGTLPFKICGRQRNDTIVHISEEDLKKLDPAVRKLVKDFFFVTKYDDKVYYPVTSKGPNSMDISFYLNHSDNPNLDLVSNGKSYYDFQTNRDIRKGEELFINYND